MNCSRLSGVNGKKNKNRCYLEVCHSVLILHGNCATSCYLSYWNRSPFCTVNENSDPLDSEGPSVVYLSARFTKLKRIVSGSGFVDAKGRANALGLLELVTEWR